MQEQYKICMIRNTFCMRGKFSVHKQLVILFVQFILKNLNKIVVADKTSLYISLEHRSYLLSFLVFVWMSILVKIGYRVRYLLNSIIIINTKRVWWNVRIAFCLIGCSSVGVDYGSSLNSINISPAGAI